MQMLLAGLHLTTLVIRRGGGKQKAWRKKQKYGSIFYLLLQLVPLQLLQDHRDGNLEAVGMTMVRCFCQAVPSRFQVIVPSETSGTE
jgi:hypothetical protein